MLELVYLYCEVYTRVNMCVELELEIEVPVCKGVDVWLEMQTGLHGEVEDTRRIGHSNLVGQGRLLQAVDLVMC